MTAATNSAMEIIIIAFLFIVDAIETLFSAFTKGILLEPKVLPPKRTQTELKKMLKKDLIDLVNQYQTC